MDTNDSVEYDGQQTAAGNLDFDEFTDEVNRLLKLAMPEEGITFTENEPIGNDPATADPPIITFQVYERLRSASIKSLDPILFNTIPDPDNPGQHIKQYRMWFDSEVDFKIYHRTNREARKLMERFEDFLLEYKGYLKNLGLSDIIFLAEKPPSGEAKWKNDLACKNLRYLIRFERVTIIRSRTLQGVQTSVESAAAPESERSRVQSPLMAAYHNLHSPN